MDDDAVASLAAAPPVLVAPSDASDALCRLLLLLILSVGEPDLLARDERLRVRRATSRARSCVLVGCACTNIRGGAVVRRIKLVRLV